VQELQQQAPLRPLTGDKFEACVVCADRASGMFLWDHTFDICLYIHESYLLTVMCIGDNRLGQPVNKSISLPQTSTENFHYMCKVVVAEICFIISV